MKRANIRQGTVVCLVRHIQHLIQDDTGIFGAAKQKVFAKKIEAEYKWMMNARGEQCSDRDDPIASSIYHLSIVQRGMNAILGRWTDQTDVGRIWPVALWPWSTSRCAYLCKRTRNWHCRAREKEQTANPFAGTQNDIDQWIVLRYGPFVCPFPSTDIIVYITYGSSAGPAWNKTHSSISIDERSRRINQRSEIEKQ